MSFVGNLHLPVGKLQLSAPPIFLRATARSAKRVLVIVILSVRLSVCHDPVPPGETEIPGFHRMIA